MFSLFKSNNPFVVVFYIVYIFAFRIIFWFNGIQADFVFANQEPLSQYAFSFLKNIHFKYEVVSAVLAGILVFVQALLVNYTVNEHKITSRKNYLTGLLFIFCVSFFKEALLLTPAGIALTFLIIATARIFSIIKKEKPYAAIFDTGFLIAIASLFYFPSIVFLVFIFWGLATVRPFAYREWAIALLGFLAPFSIAFTFYFFTGTDFALPYHNGWFRNFHFSKLQWIQLGILLFLILVSLFLLPNVLYSTVIQVRKFSSILSSFYLFAILAFFLQSQVSIAHAVFIAFPLSVISCMILLQMKRNLIPEVIHLILFLLVVAGQILPLLNIL